MNIAEAIVKTLIDEKVDLINDSSKIKHILLRHEQAVGFAAMGYALSINKPGVLMVMPGPGITNLISPVAESFYQSVPLVILTADHPRKNLGREAFHELDSFKMLKPVTKLILNPQSPKEVIPSLLKGFLCSQTGKPGPVYINIPSDFLKEEAQEVKSKIKNQKSKLLEVNLKKVSELLEKSKSPIIFSGSGVLRSDACRELQALAEKLQIPVMTTLGGKGVLPETHPLAIGAPSFDFSFEFLEESDLAIVLGARLNPVNTKMETLPLPKTMIRVDISPEKKTRYKAALNIRCDCKEFLVSLLKEIEKKKINPKQNKIIEKFKAALRDYEKYYEGAINLNDASITPPLLLKKISQYLEGKDFVFLTDSVWIPSTYLLPRILKPNSFASIRSFGCLGFAFPGAIGAAVANPQKKIISLSGDGAFLFNCQEIASCADLGLKNLYQIVMINEGYGSIKGLEENLLKGKSTAVDWKPIDFVKIAEGFGAKGFLIKERGELESIFEKALNGDGPSIIGIRVKNMPTLRKDVMEKLLKRSMK